MEVVVLLALAFFGYVFFAGYNKGRGPSPSLSKKPNSAAASERELQLQKEEDLIYQRVIKDFQAVRQRHGSAIRLLQLISWIDGTSTGVEKNIIFFFLLQQGENLLPLHKERFHLLCDAPGSIEIELRYVDKTLEDIKNRPREYQRDFVATAIAIVAGGGTPKKREAELLNKIRSFLPA